MLHHEAHNEAEGRNEEPLLQQDDLINRLGQLSDGDEVMHSTHSITQLHCATSYSLHSVEAVLCMSFLSFQTPDIHTLLQARRHIYFNYDYFTDWPIPESLQVQYSVQGLHSQPQSTCRQSCISTLSVVCLHHCTLVSPDTCMQLLLYVRCMNTHEHAGARPLLQHQREAQNGQWRLCI